MHVENVAKETLNITERRRERGEKLVKQQIANGCKNCPKKKICGTIFRRKSIDFIVKLYLYQNVIVYRSDYGAANV